MKIITTTQGSIAINPRDILVFGTNEIFEAPGRLTEENANRMIELQFAKEYNGEEIVNIFTEESNGEEIVNEQNTDVATETTGDEGFEFESIKDKDELALYALEKYSVELDTSKSLKKMMADLKEIASTPKELEAAE